MADLLNPSNFDFFARYLLAGLIIIWVRAQFVIAERPRLGEMLIEAAVLSLVNQLIALLIAEIVSLSGWQPPLSDRAIFLLEVLVMPACLGFLFGWSLSAGWRAAMLRRFSMPIQSPIRRAYDFAFLKNDREGFVIVTYEDGTTVYG